MEADFTKSTNCALDIQSGVDSDALRHSPWFRPVVRVSPMFATNYRRAYSKQPKIKEF